MLGSITEGLEELFAYICHVVWKVGCSVYAKVFCVEVGKDVDCAIWNLIFFNELV